MFATTKRNSSDLCFGLPKRHLPRRTVLLLLLVLGLSLEVSHALGSFPPSWYTQDLLIAGNYTSDQNLVERVLIEDNASPEDLGELLIAFRKAGIQVTNRVNRKRRYNWLKDIHLHLQHPEGLNFKLKFTGFQKLVFQFVYDANNEFKYFTFRINEEEVYGLVDLGVKGFKNYVCYDTGLVVRGETNEDIIRVY